MHIERIILLATLIFFSGCSQKCIQNRYECTPTEKVVNDVLKGVGDTASFLNKTMPYKYYKK